MINDNMMYELQKTIGQSIHWCSNLGKLTNCAITGNLQNFVDVCKTYKCTIFLVEPVDIAEDDCEEKEPEEESFDLTKEIDPNNLMNCLLYDNRSVFAFGEAKSINSEFEFRKKQLLSKKGWFLPEEYFSAIYEWAFEKCKELSNTIMAYISAQTILISKEKEELSGSATNKDVLNLDCDLVAFFANFCLLYHRQKDLIDAENEDEIIEEALNLRNNGLRSIISEMVNKILFSQEIELIGNQKKHESIERMKSLIATKPWNKMNKTQRAEEISKIIYILNPEGRRDQYSVQRRDIEAYLISNQ